MKSRYSTPPALLTRLGFSVLSVLVGAGLIALAVRAAGSFGRVLENVLGGVPTADGFVLFVLGVLGLIYGAVGLLFRRDDREDY